MKMSVLIKINFLVLALIIVLLASNTIRKHGLPLGLSELFGLPGNQKQSLNWCETRVESLVRPEGFKIEQVENKWFKEDKSRREVNFLAVEKWFSEYCKVTGQSLGPARAAMTSFKPVLFVKFINDRVVALGRRSDGTFLWNGTAFKSQELETGLEELGRIETPAPQD